MKKIATILFSINLLLILACERPQEPEFLRMKDVKVSNLSFQEVTIEGNAEFRNPNPYGITLTNVDLDIGVEGKKVGNIRQTEKAEIPAKKDFEIPVVANVKTSDLSMDLLGSALSLLGKKSDKKIDVTYQGTITVEAMGVPIQIPVDDKKEIDLKK